MLSGEIDAAITAHPPDCFEAGDPRVIRLYPDYRPVEEAYWSATGIFPIMHVVAIRTAALDGRPWIAMNLFKAFEQAKRNSVARAHEITATRFPIPWCFDDARRADALFEGDYWPYGIEPNRTTLEAFLRFAGEQGICRREIAVEDFFAEQVRTFFRV